ncbi:hypothetical protein JD844_022156 [Phrynosoma platyrhinos]|uniref:C-type lectin domain-containing protein n=1 Tax=Phrynosoma platyrhinos TaxID=52577 RepID=A0ABQ7SUW8_PHRPL|nr:hypothetical protein JD844_022156 [Phrynosoma platyrhinos]
MACQSYGWNAHLASIHSTEENDFIFHLMGKPLDYTKGQAYWIGAHDTFKDMSPGMTLLSHGISHLFANITWEMVCAVPPKDLAKADMETLAWKN